MLSSESMVCSSSVMLTIHRFETKPGLKTKPNSTPALSTLCYCLEEVKPWMQENYIQLNSSKTEAMLTGTLQQVTNSNSIHPVTVGHAIPLSSVITNLGVKFDPSLTFNIHI